MLETILIAVVGTTIGIVVHSLNANVAHRQPFLTDKADFYFDEMYFPICGSEESQRLHSRE